ncbi:MAG: RagB/SusD family nutrient uptake outer membrane protein, partial [Tannerellaceae bacterium]|nr:RagB/SusD family nutrient uptake outer membrane protein [Tannerellaceae bacterium]
MMRSVYNICIWFMAFIAISCNDYLDVVPDNVATIEHSFTNRVNAEKYLFTCYSYLPNPADVNHSPEFLAGCENWINATPTDWFDSYNKFNSWNIARGNQNTNKPLLNYWDGAHPNDGGGTNLFIGIR